MAHGKFIGQIVNVLELGYERSVGELGFGGEREGVSWEKRLFTYSGVPIFGDVC